MQHRPRLSDVAKACGVSAATVSRILNRDAGFSARAEVRRLIEETAKSMGYVPDLSARNLNRRNTHIVGVFGSPNTHLGAGINEGILDGITEVLHGSNYDVFFEPARVTADSANVLPFWRFDGAILLQAPRPEVTEELDRRQVPYVCANENVGNPLASVTADDVMGTQEALKHLVSLGHKKIAYANASDNYFPHYSVKERCDTFVKYAKEHNLTIIGDPASRPIRDAEREIIRDIVIPGGATAILTYDLRLALILLGEVQHQGLRVPQDISVMCFNNEFPAPFIFPSLTAIDIPGALLGQTCAKLLLAGMQSGKAAVKRQHVRIPESLIARESTGPAPKKK